MADYGLRVSQDGVDVLTGPDSGMIFTPKRPPVKILFSGTFSITVPASTTSSDITFFSGVAIASTVETFAFYDSVSGVMRRNPGVYIPTDYIGGASWSSYLSAGGDLFVPAVTVSVQRGTSSSTYPGAVTVSGKYYMVVR